MEVIERLLARIDEVDARLNAFTVVFHEEARTVARAAEGRLRAGDRAPLLGIPVSVKDHVWMAGAPATNGSLALRDFIPDEDCGAVARLREAGAVIVAKTNNPEFLYRGYTDNDLFGLTRNPWDLERTPGGSSGGSAAAVAAGLGPLSIGTDGGGSIRIPACFCGVVGLKPTFGLVPKLPGFRGWPTLSCDGPITRTVRDAALLTSVMAGMHPADPHTVPVAGLDWDAAMTDSTDLGQVRVAHSEDLEFAPVEPEVRSLFRAAVARFRDTGCTLTADGPQTEDPAPLWWRIAAAESYASEGELLASHEDEMTEGTPDIIRSGEHMTARDYLDAQNDRALVARTWAEFFERYDLLLTPAMQIPAFRVDQGAPTEIEGRACDPLFEDWCSLIYMANLTGQPSLSVPIGYSRDGLPVGMQIVGRRFDDALVLRAGAAWERLQAWPDQWPPLRSRRATSDAGSPAAAPPHSP